MLVFGKYAMETLWLLFQGTQGAIKAGERACVCSRGRQAVRSPRNARAAGDSNQLIAYAECGAAAFRITSSRTRRLLPVAPSSCTLRPGAGFGPHCGSRRAARKGTCPHRLSPLRFGEERKLGLAELCSNVHVENTQRYLGNTRTERLSWK